MGISVKYYETYYYNKEQLNTTNAQREIINQFAAELSNELLLAEVLTLQRGGDESDGTYSAIKMYEKLVLEEELNARLYYVGWLQYKTPDAKPQQQTTTRRKLKLV